MSSKKLLWLRSERFFPDFSSRVLMVFCLTFRSFIHFEFIFVSGVRKWSSFILLHVAIQFSQHHLLKRLSFLHWILFPALSKISWPYICGSNSVVSVLIYWSMCLFVFKFNLVWCSGNLYSPGQCATGRLEVAGRSILAFVKWQKDNCEGNSDNR